MEFFKTDLKGSQDLSSGALSYTSSSNNRKFKLAEVIINFSVNVTETITITRDSKHGSDYDHILASVNLAAKKNFVFRPEGSCDFQDGDEIKIQCTNANLTGIAYYTIKRRELE